nr:hypothetical protein [Tanacetum cinerariifolium]
MFNTIRVISRHQDTHIYGAMLPDELTNQEMLDSKAYKEYYDVASGAEPPKAKIKYKKKEDEPVTPSKSKSAPAAKGARLKTTATLRLKKLSWLPREARKTFTCITQVARVTELTFSQRFLMSNNKSQDDEDDVEESDMNDDSEETKSDNYGDDLTHRNLSTYKADDEEEEYEKADDDEVSFDQRVHTPPDPQLTYEEENQKRNDEVKEGIVDNYLASKMKEAVDVRRRSGKKAESSKVRTHKESKSTSSSKGTSRPQPKSLDKSAHVEEHGEKVDDLEDQPHYKFNTGNDDVALVREAQDVDKRQWNPSSSATPDCEWHKTKIVDNQPPQP